MARARRFAPSAPVFIAGLACSAECRAIGPARVHQLAKLCQLLPGCGEMLKYRDTDDLIEKQAGWKVVEHFVNAMLCD
jgi:hypothetical protein